MVQNELAEYGKKAGTADITADELLILQTHCNIFEALIIKHIRSADEFKKMI
jgi:hypothetical protein